MKIPKTYSLALPRMGMSMVFLWFGFQQLKHANEWIGFIPQIILKYSPINATSIIHFNGAFEVVFALALFFGICTRLSALLLGLHLAHITSTLGFNSISVRDFGVVMGSLFVVLYGPDELCIDRIISSPEELQEKNLFKDHPLQEQYPNHNVNIGPKPWNGT
ncbi:MAG: hypothetical protein A3E02_02045 [Candidatus Zambryskibacteria bacterium RIFCSPHIGHO2_12_FULL_38_34]|uniref:DoxX family protein n=1 Tax=Candidatus Zambryskibacteria bacterium RIFCSPLOWO2_12_FULL_39_16 TaxID=1802775 RepID=A0A1G2UR66_9BACT|nr:MAG: hypothetical protein A3D37_01830 [Candidatus Zambryskibacteria bacterium RIFCSPHIGHO2_02_FULL_38_22]OHA97366.1 MAG: hypothetical protein A3E02_02045 [Candidatus Zambryskibacteria bacterium RIFCSPHIGHO2_12_FULL_38_34]OHB08481.1 MAG: hypothetical protein A3I19_00730 [Candidatus Zambryskibacteria bacterium RIFCSPLOWO2_02_FULL_38_13]OHB11840.1 MAG: hypothetical protein A3G46_01100 [Candidatus Zambryskibacteria bacterium RIFCSPLOWO2_12_FULL_39_16]